MSEQMGGQVRRPGRDVGQTDDATGFDPLGDSDEWADEESSRMRRVVPQRAASSMSRAQWESATSQMRAIAVGGQELADSDEADVEAALASLDVLPPEAGFSMSYPPVRQREPRTALLDGRDTRTTVLRDREPRTTLLDDPRQTGAGVRGTGAYPRSSAPVRDDAGSTTVRRPTPRTQAPLTRRPVESLPYEDGAYIDVPRDMEREVRAARGGSVGAGAAVGAALLRVLAVALWLCAFALVALVVVNAIPVGLGGIRIHIVNLTARIDALLPAALSGALAFPTAFGGTFRGDLAACSLVLFVVEWLLARGARGLREGR